MGKDDLYFVLGFIAVWIVIYSVINVWSYIQKRHVAEELLTEVKDLEAEKAKLETENSRLKNDLKLWKRNSKLYDEISEGLERNRLANERLNKKY